MAIVTREAVAAGGLPGRALRNWVLGVAAWTVLGLLSTLHAYVNQRISGRTPHVGELLLERMGDWYTCALFTPVFFWLIRRFPLHGRRWARNALVLLAAVCAAVVLKYAIYGAYLAAVGLPRSIDASFTTLVGASFISEAMAFGAVTAAIVAVESQRQARERELHASRLESQLARARLEALTATLRPHFLFNTLHAVSTLMHRDVDAADRMIARLGELLRRSLAEGGVEVRVSEEMELVRSYLAIMEVRFGDRLSAELHVDPAAACALVPRLILQPLVENAIQHGIARNPGEGRLTVSATARGGRLHLAVADDGAGANLAHESFVREGTGVSNTRRRLQEMFGDDHEFRIVGRAPRGLEVRVEVPLRRAQPEAEAR